jgi:tyrosyl-tRNA synthetase
MDELDMEIRRALTWISEDCRQYWKQEIRRSTERVVQAKLALEHAQMFRGGDDRQASCIEEKKILEREKRRLQLAESRIEAVKHWSVTTERAVNEYRAIRSQFANWLDTDMPRAAAMMGRMIAALESYVRLGVPDTHVPIAVAMPDSAEKQAGGEAGEEQSKQPAE